MTANYSRLQALLLRVRVDDPILADLLEELIRAVDPQIDTIASINKAAAVAGPTLPPPVVTFQYSFTSQNVILTWENPDPTSVFFYEIRLGTVWETADILLTTATNRAVFDPLPVGTTTYLIKSVDASGNRSATATALEVTVPPISAVSLSASVVNNNVLLSWTVPTSTFAISYYIVKRGTTTIGNVVGTFTVLTEATAGSFAYKVTPVDIAGNTGPETTLTVNVQFPPGFDLEDLQTDTTFAGTKTSCVIDGDHLLAPVVSETFQEHYEAPTPDWADIQDAIDDSYTIWAQPSETTGTPKYVKTFDFGSIFTDVLLSVDYDSIVISGTVTVTVKIEVSDDDVTYSSPSTGSTYFASSVRYARVTLEFAAGDDKGLIEVMSLTCALSVQNVVDSGVVEADSADTGGTTVSFNLAFRDVSSIEATVDSTTELIVVVDFTDVVDPTDFKVLVFDTGGTRQDATVYWTAVGKI